MRASSLGAFSLTLMVSLACSSVDRGPTPNPTAAAAPDADPHWPEVGEPAPPLTLTTLSGSRVSLPESDADRAAVLIFGSFS